MPPTHTPRYDPPKPVASRYEESILRSLRRVTRAIDLHSKQLAKHYELTGPQLICLREILRREAATPSEIARAVSLSQGTVTGILDRLEKRGFVTRRKSTEDKRRVHIRATRRGRALVERAPSPLHESFSNRLSALHEGEQAMIDWILRRVVALFGADDAEEIDETDLLEAEEG